MINEGQYSALNIYNAAMLPNSEMAQSAYRKKFDLKTVLIPTMPNSGRLDPEPDIIEYQEIVMGTNTLPTEEWVKLKVFCWMLDLVFYNQKLLHLPMVLLNQLGVEMAVAVRQFARILPP